MSMFGFAQIILSQIPEFGELWFLSVLAAVMSFLYSTIGLGLGIAKAVGKIISPFNIINNHVKAANVFKEHGLRKCAKF